MDEQANQARVIPMEREKNLEERLKEIGFLKNFNFMNKFYEDEDSKKYDNYKDLELIGNIATDGTEPNLVMNETDATINKEVANYVKNKEKDVKEAIERQKEFLIEVYCNGIDKAVEELPENLKKFVKKDLSEEDIEQIIYGEVGKRLSELELNKDYDNEEIKLAYSELKEINKLKPDQREDYARESMIKQYKLSDNARNYRVRWGDSGIIEKQAAMYGRKIGKEFLKKTNKGYELNIDELVKAFGNEKSYLKMADEVQLKVAKE